MLDSLQGSFSSKRSLWLHVAVALITIAFVAPLCRRGIILSDEGYLLRQAVDLLDGRVLYRDMDSFVTPGVWFLLAGVFALFGASVIVSRVVMVLACVALTIAAFRIVRGLAGDGYGLAAVAGLLLFCVWAFPAWTFAFYSPFAVLLALWGLERLLAWQRKGGRRDLFLTGLLFGLSICFKQNYGVFAMAGAALGYALARFTARPEDPISRGSVPAQLGLVALGALAAGLPFLLYLAAHGALDDAFQSLVVHPFEFSGKHDIPYAPVTDLWKADLYTDGIEKLTYLSYAMLHASPIMWVHAFRGLHRLHVLLYWLAPLVFIIGLALSLRPGPSAERRVDAPLFTLVASCGLLFLGVLPRADFNHLVNVYQPVLVAGPVVVARVLGRLPVGAVVLRRALAAVACLLCFAYGSIALYWYQQLVVQLRTELAIPRGGVLLTPMEADTIVRMLRAIEKDSSEGEAVLTVPDLTMLNFLADRPVPSKYYNLYEHHIALDQGAAVADGAETQGVELVMTRFNNFFSDRVGLLDYAPVLARYVVTHFERAYIGGSDEYIVYRRRPEALTEQPYIDVLADCDRATANVAVEEHLLFSALYHRSLYGVPLPESGLQTTCRVRVPEAGGVLGLEVGYRKPFAVAAGTTLHGLIRARSGASEETIFDESFRVMRRQATTIEHPYKRFELDLSRWAGREIELVFETGFQGEVRTHPLDYKGFAMVWRDPRITREPGGARP